MVSSGSSTKSPQLDAMEGGIFPPKANDALLFETMLDAEQNSKELKAEQEVLGSLYRELEEERNAAATAANEAISMISRLQRERAVLQMEARHYQQRTEEKAFYDERYITLLEEIILKQEADKLALENEYKLYKQRLFKYSSSETKEESTLPKDGMVIGGVFHELPSTSDEEETLTTKSTSDSAEVVLNEDLWLRRDGDCQGEFSGPQKTFNLTRQPLEACEPWFHMLSGHHTSDEGGVESVLSVPNVDVPSHCLDVEVKDVIVQNPVRSKSQDFSVDAFEPTTLKWANVKVGAWIEEADNLDEMVEDHWQIVLEQLWKLEEQIWNLRALRLSDSKDNSWFFKDEQCKNSSFHDHCQSRKQQKESSGESKNSGFVKNEKTRRLVQRWGGMMSDGLPDVKPRSKSHGECSPDVLEGEGSNCWHVANTKVYKTRQPRSKSHGECSPDVLEGEGSNCWQVANTKVYKTRHDTEQQSMHPLKVKGEFDNRPLKSLTGKESPNLGVTVDHHEPEAGGQGIFFASKDKNAQTCKQATKNEVHKSEQCHYASSSQVANMCRTTSKEEVENCEGRLQALETARNAMTVARVTMSQNLERTETLHEITEKSLASEECSRLVETAQGAKFAAELLKGFLLFTKLGDLSSKLIRRLQFQVGLKENIYPETETESTSHNQDATPFSDLQINNQASLSSTDLTWLKDACGRSGTAFAGWDL